MLKYLIKGKSLPTQPTQPPNKTNTVASVEVGSSSKRSHQEIEDGGVEQPTSKRVHRENREELDLSSLQGDPALRKKISDYHPNDQDSVRRAYLLRGPCQPNHAFPPRTRGKRIRRFQEEWYEEFSWLEYSIHEDAAFCLYCYLFKPNKGAQGGGDVFSHRGFTNWERKTKLKEHVGGPNSAHNIAYRAAQALLNQEQHIETFLHRQSDQVRRDYRIHLTAITDCIRFLLRQGLAFRGHDESDESINKGNFLELIRFLKDHNEVIKKVLDNASKNRKLTSPNIQKDIVNSAAVETTNAILKDYGNSLFAILVDEARDISIKEQMAVVLRYVDKKGCVIERFFGVVHVKETSALTLKKAIDELFSKHGLSISRLRGQGYDGASNMQGDLNGLKALVMKENESAFYVHCFAHQLQLALVAVAKNHESIANLFSILSNVVNTVGASCKRRDMLRDAVKAKVVAALQSGEISSGKGLNQETSLKRSGDTRWGSHYYTLLGMITTYGSVIDVLDNVAENGSSSEQRGEAYGLLDSVQSFEFIFNLHLMKAILGISNDLSKALQREDQDIVNAMALVKITKIRLQAMRDDGWDSLLTEVSSLCVKHDVVVPNMEERYMARGRSRRRAEGNTNLHYYRVGLFYHCIDLQIQELNDRFNEANTELLLCMACLDPSESFVAFDKQKLIRFARLYPDDFSEIDQMELADQLENYIIDVRSDTKFGEVNGISGLAKKMVETKKEIVYPLVYLLIKLALILPVATATVERAFSAMNIIKNRLRNRMADEWLNDCLITYIEKEVFDSIDTELILQRFQKMKKDDEKEGRRGQL